METRRADTATVDRITGAVVKTRAGFGAAVAIETWEARLKKKKRKKKS